MQGKDYKGQDLRGQSFNNQNLAAADFSDCDVRGVDFSGADLSNAKFCYARMGKTLKASFVLLLLQLLIGVLSGILAGASNYLILTYPKDILFNVSLNSDVNQFSFMAAYSFASNPINDDAVSCSRKYDCYKPGCQRRGYITCGMDFLRFVA